MEYLYKNGIDNSDEIPDLEGIDRAYAKLHFADNETLKDCLRKFYLSLTQDSDTLNKLSASVTEGNIEDIPVFRNLVHSTKSSAALLGMVQISGLAKTAEDAAKGNDIEVIRVITPLLTREMKRMKTRLEVLYPQDSGDLPLMTDKNITLAQLELLRQAFENLDISKMDKIMKSLKSQRFEENLQHSIDLLELAVKDIRLDEGIALIQTLKDILLAM